MTHHYEEEWSDWYKHEDRTTWVLPRILTERAAELGDKPFLQYAYEPPISYRDTNRRACQVANYLKDLGVQYGDKVSMFSPNCADYVMWWFGTLKLGAVIAPANTAYKGDFLHYAIDKCDAKVLIIAEDLLDRLALVQDGLNKLQHVVVWNKTGTPVEDNKGVTRWPLLNAADMWQASDDEPGVDVKFYDAARIIYTSGTTGRSKGVVKPHAADYYTARSYINVMRLTDQDVGFTVLPLFHSNAQVVLIYPCMIAGARAAVFERFSASQYWKWIKDSGATVFNLLGAMSHFIWNTPPVPEEKEHKVRLICASPAPKDLYHGFKERFNLDITEGYGLTETGMCTYMPPNEPYRVGSMGKASPGYIVKIVDPESHEELPPNTPGEIAVQMRIPNIMMLEYYGMPEKTAEDFKNLMLHTGDLGRMDEDGYFYFMDRVKDYIRRRGENISSFEVERMTNGVPGVKESAAVAVPAGEKGMEDEVMIVVVKEKDEAGEALTEWKLLEALEPIMPYFMVPRYVKFVSALPKTPTERVQKNILREEGAKGAWDREEAGYKLKR